jgi:hypothetical protein
MNNMKKLVGVVVFSLITLIAIGCGKSPLAPSSSVPAAGVYFIPATTAYQSPQTLISTGSEIRLGSESKVLEIVSAQVVNDSVVNLTMKYNTANGGSNNFSATARRLPVSVNEYGTSSAAHPFNGLYSSRGGAYIFAVSSDSVVIMTTAWYTWVGDGGPVIVMGWNREKVSTSMNALNSDIKLEISGDREITYNPITPLTPPYQSGLAQYYPPTGNGGTEQIVGLDSLGR